VVHSVSRRESVLARRLTILERVQSGGCTVKKLSELLGVSKKTICSDIHTIGDIHWQDDVLYYGERL